MHLRQVHAYSPEEMVKKRYKVGFPIEVILGGSEGSKVAEAGLDVTWDEKKLTINQALLVFSAHGRNDGWPLFIRSVEARLYLNDYLVGARGWPGYWAPCVTQTIETNVGAYFINGRNRFKLEVVASWGPLAAGIDAISANLELWFTPMPGYEEEEPTVTPPPPEWFEDIWPYLKWGLVGVAVVGITYVGIELTKRRS